MAKGRFCFPKTIEEEEFCIERALPKSTRYKNKWAVSVFKDWQWSRGWWSFKEYELDKVQLLTWPITEIDALMLSYWLSKFVQEVAKCSKDPYIPSKNIVSDCLLKRTQPSSSIPWSLQTKGKLHRTFLFSSLDLLSLDKYWTQKWRMGAGIGLKAKQKGRARYWWRRKEAVAKWSIWNGD